MSKNIKRFLSLWVPVILLCVIIFYCSSIPDLSIKQLGIWDLIFRKIAHFTEFGILALLLYRAIKGSTNWSTRKVFFWAIFWTIVYAVTDEYHQYFVPSRITSAYDVLIDSAGGIFWTMFYIIGKQRKTLESETNNETDKKQN